jgi:hypothetical protein
MTEHLSEDDLILVYYDEPEVSGAMRAHAAECAECRYAAETLKRVLDSCSEWEVPEPSADLARRVKARLTPVYEMPVRGTLWVAAAIAAVLLITFFAGRVTQKPQPSVFAGLSSDARHRILEIALADHLDRAEMLLTEIANAPEGEQVDRARAQDLVDEGRLIRQTLERQGEPVTVATLDEVERYVLDAANAKGDVDVAGVRDLLFKVRIIEANLKTRGQRT